MLPPINTGLTTHSRRSPGTQEGSRMAQFAMAADGMEVMTEDKQATEDVTRIIKLIYLW